MKVSGTREWAVATVNCCDGCPHNCRYCYARYDAVVRKKDLSEAEWLKCRLDQEKVGQAQPLYPGQVMFPSRHDIVPDNLSACLVVLEKLLDAGNQVLIVTKPHLVCIEAMCNRFEIVQNRILFRFTITADNDRILKFWEPGAPSYQERRRCLQYAHAQGFQTSVSVEPMLDSEHVGAMVHDLAPFVTHSIWLGKMNKIRQRVVCDSHETEVEINRIEKAQSDQRIITLYNQMKTHPLIRWKESIKRVVGLELVEKEGLDI